VADGGGGSRNFEMAKKSNNNNKNKNKANDHTDQNLEKLTQRGGGGGGGGQWLSWPLPYVRFWAELVLVLFRNWLLRVFVFTSLK